MGSVMKDAEAILSVRLTILSNIEKADILDVGGEKNGGETDGEGSGHEGGAAAVERAGDGGCIGEHLGGMPA